MGARVRDARLRVGDLCAGPHLARVGRVAYLRRNVAGCEQGSLAGRIGRGVCRIGTRVGELGLRLRELPAQDVDLPRFRLPRALVRLARLLGLIARAGEVLGPRAGSSVGKRGRRCRRLVAGTLERRALLGVVEAHQESAGAHGLAVGHQHGRHPAADRTADRGAGGLDGAAEQSRIRGRTCGQNEERAESAGQPARGGRERATVHASI